MMPYIRKERRLEIVSRDNPLAPYYTANSPGELNFLLTLLVRNYFEVNGENYQAINDVLGALEGAKLEFYRRVAAPYEDKKIGENGDVYV